MMVEFGATVTDDPTASRIAGATFVTVTAFTGNETEGDNVRPLRACNVMLPVIPPLSFTLMGMSAPNGRLL